MKKGIWSLIPDLDILMLLTRIKDLSFIIFDTEHGGWSYSDLPFPIQFLKAKNIESVIRIGSADQIVIQQAIDCNPDFVQVSGIESVNDYEETLRKFSKKPYGSRGFSPWSYNSIFKDSEKSPKLILQVESEIAINSVMNLKSEIKEKVEHIFLGRYDLSASLGMEGQLTTSLVSEKVDKIYDYCVKNSISISTVCTDVFEFEKFRELNFDMLSVSSDRQVILNGLQSL